MRCKLGEVLRLEAKDMNESKSRCDGGLVELSWTGIALTTIGVALNLVYVSIILR